jgi:hypothetical protein
LSFDGVYHKRREGVGHMKLGCDRSIRDDRQFAEDRNNGGRFQGIIVYLGIVLRCYQGFGNAVGRVRGRPRGTAGSNTTWTEFPGDGWFFDDTLLGDSWRSTFLKTIAA